MNPSKRQVALITGANSGIGAAISETLASEGYAIVLAARREDQGMALERQIKEAGGDAVFVRADLTREENIRHLHEKALSVYGRIDAAVNNAGVHRGQMLTESSIEDYNAIMDTNVRAVWLGMKYQIEAMRQTEDGGAIVNIASNVGHNGAHKLALYVASKHAVIGLTKAAAIDHGAEGIRINTVSPGPIRTEMFEKAVDGDPELEAAITNWVPLGRVGTAREVARVVRWLVSEEASFVNGHSLAVDGGTLAGFN